MQGKIRSAAERARLVEAYRSSGLSGQAFARREGLPPSTLHQWLADGKATTANAAPVRLARVVRAVNRPGPSAGRGRDVIVEIGAARVRVGPGFDRELLQAVVEVLHAAVRAG